MAIREPVMARYSVATTKNNLSSLIDKALAGEEVVITRHGKPTVLMSVVPPELEKPKLSRAEMAASLERIRLSRESRPPMKLSYLEMKRLDQADYEH
jgi:prevent-host-death family protein